MFRRAYEFQRKEVLRLLSDRREHPIPIRHIEVRILPRQPAIPALGSAPEEKREWAGNPGFSRIRFRLQTPGLPKLRKKSSKVSGQIRKYSRFAETIGGDRFDHHCRPSPAAQFCALIRAFEQCLPACNWIESGR
jgi:hypothetical protein